MNAKSPPTIEQLLLRVEQLQSLVAAQQKEIGRLQAALAAAQKTSANSSKPPSSDIVKPKKNKDQDDPNAPKRKIGGQTGPPAHFRPELPLDQIDRLVVHTLEQCPHCGTKLQPTDRKPIIVQQIKIVEKLHVAEEHQGTPYWCPTCQCFHYAPLPPEIEHGGLFDAKLTSIVVYIKSVCHCSFSTLRKFMRDVFGITVSRGYLRALCEKVSASLRVPYESLAAMLPNLKRLNIDDDLPSRRMASPWNGPLHVVPLINASVQRKRALLQNAV